MSNDTLKNSEVEALRAAGQVVSDFKAVIRTKKAAKLVVPSLGTFLRDEPIHTNDEAFIEKALGTSGLAVTVDPALYKTKAQRKAEDALKAKIEAEAKAKAEASKPSSPKP